MSRDEILNHIKNRFLSIGRSEGFMQQPSNVGSLSIKPDFISITKAKITKNKTLIALVVMCFIFGVYYLL